MQVRAKYGASATPNRRDKEWVDERFVDYSRTSYGSLGPGGDRYVKGEAVLGTTCGNIQRVALVELQESETFQFEVIVKGKGRLDTTGSHEHEADVVDKAQLSAARCYESVYGFPMHFFFYPIDVE